MQHIHGTGQHIHGTQLGAEQVRYDGYDHELDEWLLLDAVREPTELIETLKEIPKASSRVSLPT